MPLIDTNFPVTRGSDNYVEFLFKLPRGFYVLAKVNILISNAFPTQLFLLRHVILHNEIKKFARNAYHVFYLSNRR